MLVGVKRISNSTKTAPQEGRTWDGSSPSRFQTVPYLVTQRLV